MFIKVFLTTILVGVFLAVLLLTIGLVIPAVVKFAVGMFFVSSLLALVTAVVVVLLEIWR